jgi:mannose-6-phosphate isomerase-like protein (cupin superfamily)
MHKSINFQEKFQKVSDFWTPKILTQFDDYYLKATKMKGEFVWHSHSDVDELFIVVSGNLKIFFRDGEVELRAGECYVVPRGVEHKPVADEEAHVLLVEKKGTLNTGNQRSEKTVDQEEWI